MGFECVFYISACNVACNGCTGPGPDACVNCADQFYRVGTTCRGTQVHHVHIYILLKFIRTKESCFFCDHCFKVKSKERYLKKAIKFTPYFISIELFKESSVKGIIRVLCLISKGCNIACDGCTSAGPENCNTCSAGFYPVGGICRGKFPSVLNKT